MYYKCQLNYTYSHRHQVQQIVWGTLVYQNYSIILLTSQRQIIGLGMAFSNDDCDAVYQNLNMQLRGLESIHDDDEINQHFNPSKWYESLTIHLYGTVFQHRVWKILRQIPYGQTVTYQQIAQLIDQPQAARAVGQAVGRNPVSYLIPCHRVTPSNGQLGHFRWGSDVKQKMLQLEFENIKNT